MRDKNIKEKELTLWQSVTDYAYDMNYNNVFKVVDGPPYNISNDIYLVMNIVHDAIYASVCLSINSFLINKTIK